MAVTARSPNTWWLLPGALALVAAAVIELRGGQLPAAAVDVGTGAAFYVAGAVAYLAKPANRAAWLLLLTATAVAAGKAAGDGVSAVASSQPEAAHSWVAAVLINAAGWAILAAGVALFATFPDGKYQRRYERWVVRSVLPAFVPLQALQLLGSARLSATQFGWVPVDAPSPVFVPALAPLGSLAGGLMAANSILILPAILLLLLRYRRFGRDQRHQIQWPLYAVALAALSFVSMALEPGPPAMPFWLVAAQYVATQAVLPAGLAMGIVMHRSLDIENVIRRSVVYGALWGLIAALYVLVAGALGIAAGQRVPLALAVLLTIVATLLFQPARRRLERLADRLVFGPRLTGYELISQLGTRLQSMGAAEDVAGTVAGAVRTGIGASWVRVGLNLPQPTIVASVGQADGAGAALAAQLVHDDQVVGVIECGPKVDARYDDSDQDLLNTLGRQAALAVRNAQLSGELRDRLEELAASRVRLVQAEEAGRRRLERDLHDGVQQQLVALLARLGLARNQLRRDGELAEATLQEAQVDAQRALETLQEVARGIHPAILTDRGLVEAVEERASRLTVPVQVTANGVDRGTRFPPELEGAAYFFVSEALANVLKFASATSVQIRFQTSGAELVIEVADDGRGFELGKVKLSGLLGLTDRLEALGGRMEVASEPGRGTRLRASLPAGESVGA